MSHVDPYLFPFKAIYERRRNAVGAEMSEAEPSQRMELDALFEGPPPSRTPPMLGEESGSEEYHAGSSGVSRALGRETAVYKGSRRHPEWPPEVWKTLAQHERRRLSAEFLQYSRPF